MGLAASQTRFLGLTARKSNVEFQGQQVNQARVNLSNQSAAYNSQSLGMTVPVPPSVTQFSRISYTWVGLDNVTNEINSLVPIANPTGPENYNITTTTNNTPQPAVIARDATGRMTSVAIGGQVYNLVVNTETDDAAYNDAMQQYEYNRAVYDQNFENISARLSILQAQDRSLELKLKQLDTEQQAIQTEIEAVTKVIDKNIESTFKTFA